MSIDIVPVIDLKGGLAVHAVGGERANYQPVAVSALPQPPIPSLRPSLVPPGDVASLTAFYAARKPAAIYVADLDAITGKPPQIGAWRTISQIAFCPLWLDFGVETVQSLAPFIEFQRSGPLLHRLILGSETLHSLEQIEGIAQTVPQERLILSLDRRGGQALRQNDPLDERELLAAASAVGIRTLIALDLAAVGKGAAQNYLVSWRGLMEEFSHFNWYLGGGVASKKDLAAACQQGFRGVLSATAILKGDL